MNGPLSRPAQFTLEPAARFDGNHWVYKRDKYFVYVVAQGALKCTKVIAGRARGDASQHRLCLAFRARWSRDMDHHARLRLGGSATLSVTGNGQWRAVMEPSWSSGSIVAGQYCSHSQI